MKINEDCACQVQNCGPYGSCTIFQVFWSYIIALFEKKKSYLLQIFPWHVQVQRNNVQVHKQIILVNQIFLLNQMIHSQIKLILFSGLTHLLKLTSNDSFKVFLRFQALQSSSPYSLLWKEQPAHYLKCLFLCIFYRRNKVIVLG